MIFFVFHKTMNIAMSAHTFLKGKELEDMKD